MIFETTNFPFIETSLGDNEMFFIETRPGINGFIEEKIQVRTELFKAKKNICLVLVYLGFLRRAAFKKKK